MRKRGRSGDEENACDKGMGKRKRKDETIGRRNTDSKRDKAKEEVERNEPRAGWFSCCEDNLGQARLKIFIKLHARSTYDRFDSH